MSPLGIALFSLLSMATLQTPSAVQGVVLKSATGEPISGARVELIRTDGSTPQSYSAVSAPDGTFTIANARPGQYRLAANRSGFLRREFGQRSGTGFGVVLNLEANQQIGNLEIELRPSAAISGRVTDREGSPVTAAEVRAMVTSYSNGQRILRVVQSTTTNDLGEYRLFSLPAGRYFVSVSPSADIGLTMLVLNPSVAGQPGNVGNAPAGRSRIAFYYPNTTDSRNATPIDLTSGGDFGGVNITMALSRPYHIRGNVPGGNANVSLVPTDPGLAASIQQANASDGPFDFPSVIPAEYTLVARSGDLLGRVTVNLGEGDLDNVTVGLNPTVSVPTRVSFEDRKPGEMDPDLEGASFTLVADPVIPGAAPDVYGPFANGFLAFGVLLRQDYRIAFRGVQGSARTARLRDVYIKSMRMGNRDVMNDGLRIDDPENLPPLEIVLGLRSGTLTGSVFSEKQKPLANAPIVLIPDGARRRWPDSIRTAATELSGRYTIDRIPPGNYTAFSWEEIEEGAWMDPEFMKRYEERGTKIQILEGMNGTVNVTAFP
jgi:hypothetical protein